MPRQLGFLPHQIEALEKLRSGCILCGGVGTGKSITALGWYYIYACEGTVFGDLENIERFGPMKDPKDLYIITTARKRDTHEWEAEVERFPIADEGVTVTIDSWNNIHKYADVIGAVFLFDEQRVVGSGKWAKDFVKIARSGNEWLLLSATPGDTWADYIPVFLANGFYKNRTAFLKRHAVYSRYVTKYPKIERWLEAGYLERLRRRILVKMSFERKTTAHWERRQTSYDHERYDRVWRDRWDIYKDEPLADAGAVCQVMRRVASEARTEAKIEEKRFSVNERALRIFQLMLEVHPRVIVFYNYDYELEALRECFETLREPSGELYETAEWNGHRHDQLPSSVYWAYFVQYTAGCEGWNCVETNCVVFYSQSYSYKQMTQAAGRIDRLNTPFVDLYYYIYESEAPIDKAIRAALKGKKNFNEKAFVDGRV